MDTLLSIDLGTTGCKAAVCALDGRVLGTSTIEYPLIHRGPGWVEQDAAQWWLLSVESCREALGASDIDGRSVRAVSASTQGISFVPIAKSGEILRNALCWLDTRATEEAEAIHAAVGDERLFQITGKRPSAAYILPKLLWLRTHEPELFRATHKFLMAHDYLVYRLCGATVTDYSLAGGSLLLDVSALTWSEHLLDAFEIDPARLPDLAWAGTVAGGLVRTVAESLGLTPGIPVVVGGQDQKCAALGAAIRAGVATVSLGTASAISSLVDRPLLDPARRVPTFPFVVRGHWDLEGVVGTAGAALKWARETLFASWDYNALDDLAAQAPPGAHGVCFFPHLAGATSPLWRADSRGAFTGLALGTGRADIVRSVLEGVAFQIGSNLAAIGSLAEVDELILFGGGARSSLWRQIIAEVTGRPTRATHLVDVANWGACILAGLGAGLYADAAIPRLASALTPPFEPAPDAVARYRRFFARYVEMERALL